MTTSGHQERFFWGGGFGDCATAIPPQKCGRRWRWRRRHRWETGGGRATNPRRGMWFLLPPSPQFFFGCIFLFFFFHLFLKSTNNLGWNVNDPVSTEKESCLYFSFPVPKVFSLEVHPRFRLPPFCRISNMSRPPRRRRSIPQQRRRRRTSITSPGITSRHTNSSSSNNNNSTSRVRTAFPPSHRPLPGSIYNSSSNISSSSNTFKFILILQQPRRGPPRRWRWRPRFLRPRRLHHRPRTFSTSPRPC